MAKYQTNTINLWRLAYAITHFREPRSAYVKLEVFHFGLGVMGQIRSLTSEI